MSPYSTIRDCPPERWDAFLESIPEGHFQQSSMWAEAKAIEGWEPILVTFERDGQIRGGFQILTKHTRFGRIGYVSKGPALADEHPDLQAQALKGLVDTTSKRGLRALIVQAPDQTRLSPIQFSRLGCLPNYLINVISATLLVDLEPAFEEVEARMRETTLKQVRRAQRRGVNIREGGDDDVSTFFRLMETTCKRQKTHPSPASAAALMGIWKAFHPHGRARLSLAEVDNTPVAGLFCFRFGDRVSAWKKGWSGDHSDRHPNVLVSYEAVQWAHSQGCRMVDFMGFDREWALRCQNEPSFSESRPGSLYWFNLGFGSRPIVLPEAWIFVPNPMMRLAYRLSVRCPGFSQLKKRLSFS